MFKLIHGFLFFSGENDNDKFLISWFGLMQVFGLLTKPIVRLMISSKHLSRSLSIDSTATPKSYTVPLLSNGQDSEADLGIHQIPRPSSLRMLLAAPTHTVHHYWRKFDNAFMRPVFGGRGFVPFIPGSPTERQNVNPWQSEGAH